MRTVCKTDYSISHLKPGTEATSRNSPVSPMTRPLFPRLLSFLAVLMIAGPAAGQITTYRPASAAAREVVSPRFAVDSTGAVTFSADPYRSADIAVDVMGGLHVAFVSLGQLAGTGDKPAHYGYCPAEGLAACASPAGWSLVEVSTGWPHVRLALTPEGRPRLFLYDDRAHVERVNTTVYAYAECQARGQRRRPQRVAAPVGLDYFGRGYRACAEARARYAAQRLSSARAALPCSCSRPTKTREAAAAAACCSRHPPRDRRSGLLR